MKTIQERYEAIPQIEKAKMMYLMKKNRAKRLAKKAEELDKKTGRK